MEPSYSKRRDQARAYSQCKRLEIAFDSVFKDFEPNMSYKYSAIVRARPDAIYLTTVPPLSSFNLSRFTFSTGAVSDHWHVVGRGCPLVSPYCSWVLFGEPSLLPISLKHQQPIAFQDG